MKTAVIILHYRGRALTSACLQSLQKATNRAELEVIVVVNGNQTEGETLLEHWGEQATFLFLQENKGFTGANNEGLKYALEELQCEACVLLNNDTIVAPDTISSLIATLQSHPKAGSVAPKIYFAKGHEFHPGYTSQEKGSVLWYAGGQIDWKEMVAFHAGVDEVDHGQADTLTETPFTTGCCVAYRSQALQEVGLLDDRYFLYWEDVELSIRLSQAGWKNLYAPASWLWHENAGSSQGAGSPLSVYYQTRNRLLFGMTYAPLRTKLFLLKHAVLQLLHGQTAVRQAILDAARNSYGRKASLH